MLAASCSVLSYLVAEPDAVEGSFSKLDSIDSVLCYVMMCSRSCSYSSSAIETRNMLGETSVRTCSSYAYSILKNSFHFKICANFAD